MGLFSIPMFGISRAKEWVVLCRRKDRMNKEAEYLYKNFEDIMFANDLKNRLQPQAKPALFNIPNAPPTVVSKRRTIQKAAARIS